MTNKNLVKFKVGDLVYCSAYTASVCQIRRVGKHTIGIVRLSDSIKVFDIDDCSLILCDDEKTLEFVDDDCNVVRICHATQQNYELLSQLYPNVAFEPPPKRKEPREIIEAMLESGWEYVVMIKCGALRTIHYRTFLRPEWEWVGVRPIDPKTGKTIIDFVDGEVVLESENE